MTARRAATRRGVVGRYDGRQARSVGDLARPVPSLNVRTAVGAVPNPLDPAGKELIAVTINRMVDILEDERKGGHISEGAYRTGRDIQAAMELHIKSSSNWMDGGASDPTTAREMQLIYGIERARRAAELEADIRSAVGNEGAKLIRLILGDGWTYGQIAIREGRSADYGKRQVGARFRWLLEAVTEHRSTRTRRAA